MAALIAIDLQSLRLRWTARVAKFSTLSTLAGHRARYMSGVDTSLCLNCTHAFFVMLACGNSRRLGGLSGT